MAKGCSQQRLLTIATEVRAFLEPHWADWHQHAGSPRLRTLSQGTCGRSSLVLRDVLRAKGFSAMLIAGSPSEGPQGFWFEGAWHGHAWVECDGWIVDVTADQFDAPPVIVTPVGDSRYRAGVDAAEPEFLARRQRVAAALMAQWNERMKEGMHHET